MAISFAKIETTKCNNNSTLIVLPSSFRENKFRQIQLTSISRNLDAAKITRYTVYTFATYPDLKNLGRTAKILHPGLDPKQNPYNEL